MPTRFFSDHCRSFWWLGRPHVVWVVWKSGDSQFTSSRWGSEQVSFADPISVEEVCTQDHTQDIKWFFQWVKGHSKVAMTASTKNGSPIPTNVDYYEQNIGRNWSQTKHGTCYAKWPGWIC